MSGYYIEYRKPEFHKVWWPWHDKFNSKDEAMERVRSLSETGDYQWRVYKEVPRSSDFYRIKHQEKQ